MIKYIFIHIVLSLLVTLFCLLLFRDRFKKDGYTPILYIALFNLLLPVLAYILTLSIATIFFNLKDRVYLKGVKRFNKREFLNSKFSSVNRLFGEGSGFRVSAMSSHEKMKSLVFMAENLDKRGFKIIKTLLGDSDNEVRLFSFSLLNNAQREINENISRLTHLLNSTKDLGKKSEISVELVQLYWDIIHYGFSSKESEGLTISKIEHYASLALKSNSNREDLYTILAKLYFYQKDYDRALEFFYLAISSGALESGLLFYLAEIAYERGDYSEVTRLLSRVEEIETSISTAPIYRQWIER